MEPVVKAINLKRFRSIPSGHVDFGNPTFLVGQNGSGKSNFVDAFAFLADAMSLPLQAVFDKRGGIATVRNRTSGRSYPPNLGLGVVLGAINRHVESGRYAFEVKAVPPYAFEVVREQCLVCASDGKRHYFDRRGKQFRCNVKGVQPSLDPASLALPVVGGNERFEPILRTLGGMRAYSLEPGKIREMQDPDSGLSLKRDGSNAASVLQQIERNAPEDLERICQILSKIVPCTKTVRPTKHGNKLSLKFTQEWGQNKRLTFESFNMSDGTLRALGMLTAVYQQPAPSLVAVEEPEATIHPGAIGAILDLLRHAGKKMQVVVTTHSPEVLDAKWIADTHLRVVEWQEGATSISP
ncbi:hypothetical protein LCGC14_2469180, partial [marine sediment metagenome]